MARMPRRRKIDRQLDQLERRYRGQLSAAFFESVRSITDNVRLSDIVRAIEAADFERVIMLLSLEPAAFRSVARTMEDAFETTGATVAAAINAARARRFPSGNRSIFRFDIQNNAAETWLRERSSYLITGDILQGTRDAIRLRLQEGMISGHNPRTVALDIVGRIDSTTGRRTGGLVGLNGPQSKSVSIAQRELASTRRTELNAYLRRKRRDRRFDHYVNRALKSGTPIPTDIRNKMVARYSDRLLKLRGDTIGRKEMIETLNRAQFDSYNQAIAKGHVKEKTVRKFWDSSGGGRVRDSHSTLDGTDVGMKEAFISPATGESMLYPGDTSLGAHGEDVINCRCRVRYSVDFMEGLT